MSNEVYVEYMTALKDATTKAIDNDLPIQEMVGALELTKLNVYKAISKTKGEKA